MTDGPLFEKAERIEYEVFRSLDYCEPSEELRSMEYEPWRTESVFHVVVEATGRVAGTIRTVMGKYLELPVGQLGGESAAPPDPVLEYASLAVPEDHRAQGVAEALYRAVFQDAVRSGSTALVAIGEQWIQEFLNGTFGLGFARLAPARWYMGGECFPMAVPLTELIDRLAAEQPSFLRYLMEDLELSEATLEDVRQSLDRAHSVSN